jgi:transposase
LLLEGSALPDEERGEWLRAKGLHTEHLSLYEQEIRQSMTDKEKRQREEIERLRKDKKVLERELLRKDRALAEMAALVALKKKLEVIFGEDEEA